MMNKDLIEQLSAAIEKADQSDLMDGGRYFADHLCDLTRCRHGETGEYLREADGQLVELLWNNRHTFLNTLRHVAPVVEAAEALVNMIEHSMTGMVHAEKGPFIKGVTDLDITPDGSVKLSHARRALAPFQQGAPALGRAGAPVGHVAAGGE